MGQGSQRNTDDYVAFEVRTTTDDGATELTAPVAVVAAGAHTHGREDRLSQVAVEAIYAVLRSEQALPIAPRLVEALHAANQVLYQQAAVDPSLAGRGASVVAATIVGNMLYLAYVGDCRAYLIRDGYAHRLTLPHQPLPAPEAPLAAVLTPAYAGQPVGSVAVALDTPLLGRAEFVDVATAIAPLDQRASRVDPLSPPLHHPALRLAATDTLLLCTPGLYQVIPDRELAEATVGVSAQEAAWQLADQANRAQAAESYTALILQQTRHQTPQAAPAPGRRSLRRLRRPLLAALLFLVVVLSWSFLAEQGSRLATLAGSQIPSGFFATFAQSLGDAAGRVQSATAPVAAPKPEREAAPPVEAPVAAIAVAPVAVEAPAERHAIEPAAAVSQRLAASMLTTTQNRWATLVDRIEQIGALAAAARTATAVAVAALPTATPTPLPPTPTPVPPTPTPVPTQPRAVAVARATATPRPPTPVPAAGPDLSQAAVTLIEPAEYDTLTDKRSFQWQANFALPPGYAFEVVFWQPNQDPMRHGRGYAGLAEKTTINASYEHFRQREAPEGEYRWGVLLVTQDPYQRIKFLGGGRVIYVKRN